MDTTNFELIDFDKEEMDVQEILRNISFLNFYDNEPLSC